MIRKDLATFVQANRNDHIIRAQAGLRSGYSTLEHIYIIKQLFEKSKEYDVTFYCCFLDYSKAFDTIEHEKIWQALKNQGIENKYIRILKNICDNSETKIKPEKEGKEIKIERGLRQGDSLSPQLFTAILKEVFRQLDWEQCGLSINGENLSNLRFAIDLIISSSTGKGLQAMLNDLLRESSKMGLDINTLKTKAMANNIARTYSDQ
ncbi:Retrovirus-related Pol polyprotein from type-1 retrotransposable element R2 [Eumeta japonica]|uniref:Retrovirus-related Pol polyprotein from type-1 retrotransposable element R2 n=1 Tax=Eumeta variegata TaxID=151549 RepID=A0A4C1WAY5_EUMVA|nr:Retrovirus-related Pol polyprotein from type-1 retrotransposable element R2 [Eumeta japonica]